MVAAIWRIQEDSAGRWRDFPPGLANQTEQEFQQWVSEGAPPGYGFQYVWDNLEQTKFTEYSIIWPDDVDLVCVQDLILTCVQVNTKTSKRRAVQRIPIMPQRPREVN